MLLSLVTATLNADPLINETAGSIHGHPTEIEWVIKDSSPVVDRRLAGLCITKGARVAASVDTSLYEALNQALPICTGDYVMILGAGDTIIGANVAHLLAALRTARTHKAACFFPVVMDKTGKLFQARPDLLAQGMTTPHPGAILWRERIIEVGGFDIGYKIAADYDLLCRYLTKWPERYTFDTPVVSFRGGGISDRNPGIAKLEETLIRARSIRTP
jgi:glycosyltransferase